MTNEIQPVFSRQRIIDDLGTGSAAKLYREGRRVTLRELAPRLETPAGVPMSFSNLDKYEMGKRCWADTGKPGQSTLFARYIRAVNEIAATFTK